MSDAVERILLHLREDDLTVLLSCGIICVT